MAALVCDICGGKLSMGTGGLAVCDSCGMEHTKERVQEKVQEIKGVVRIDNSHMIDNYLGMAQSAYSSNNQAESESYCNKIIEIDPQNYQAWILKGKAAGWQSSIANDRILEASRCFLAGIDNAPEEEKRMVVIETCSEVKNLCTALVQVCCDNFSEYCSSNNASTLVEKTTQAIDMAKAYTGVGAVKQFKEFDIEKMSNSEDAEANEVEMMSQLAAVANIQWLEQIGGNLADLINSALVAAWNSVLSDYHGDEGKPSDWDLKQFLESGDIIIRVLKVAAAIEDSTSDKILYYKNLIIISEAVRDCQSWEKEFTSYGSYWAKSKALTNEAKAARNVEINNFKAELQKLKAQLQREEAQKALEEEEERQAVIKQYWEDHADEKAELDAESQSLVQQIVALNTKIENVPGLAEIVNIQERISKLETDKGALGIFKVKERKSIQSQIDTANAELTYTQGRCNNAIEEIRQKIAPLKKRKEEIEAEFTKDRE